ncbi:MAG: hypothetical protein R2865_10780 [Deinococcales bacterium]
MELALLAILSLGNKSLNLIPTMKGLAISLALSEEQGLLGHRGQQQFSSRLGWRNYQEGRIKEAALLLNRRSSQ